MRMLSASLGMRPTNSHLVMCSDRECRWRIQRHVHQSQSWGRTGFKSKQGGIECRWRIRRHELLPNSTDPYPTPPSRRTCACVVRPFFRTVRSATHVRRFNAFIPVPIYIWHVRLDYVFVSIASPTTANTWFYACAWALDSITCTWTSASRSGLPPMMLQASV